MMCCSCTMAKAARRSGTFPLVAVLQGIEKIARLPDLRG
jgi:hypothetical protein